MLGLVYHRESELLDADIEALIEQRTEARKAKNFVLADQIRDELKEKGILFAAGCLICLALIGVTTYIQYNATFLSTYVESGVRRITLAEKLRKIPLSFFGKKDLSDLTSTIMAKISIFRINRTGGTI